MVSPNQLHAMMLLIVLITTACAPVATLVHDSGIKIEPISNETGRIRSPGFWIDRDGISLRGEVLPGSAEQSSMTGHVDISITVPDGSNSVCTIALLKIDRRSGASAFSQRFVSLPPRGSRVRIWHDSMTATHHDCVN